MEQYIIKGGNPLVGEVVIGGAKNAALPVLAAAVMTDGKCMIDNMPDVRDHCFTSGDAGNWSRCRQNRKTRSNDQRKRNSSRV